MFHALDFRHSGDSPRFPVFPANRVISGQAYLESDEHPLHRPSQPVAVAGIALTLLILLLLNLDVMPLWLALVTGATGVYGYLCFAVNEDDPEIENVTPIADEAGCIDPAAIEKLMTILMRHRLSAFRSSPVAGLVEADYASGGPLRHEIGLDRGVLTHSIVSDHPDSRRETQVDIAGDRQLSALTREIFGDDRNRVSVCTGGAFDDASPPAGR